MQCFTTQHEWYIQQQATKTCMKGVYQSLYTGKVA